MATRSLQVINNASVCEDAAAFRDPKLHTLEQFRHAEYERCPLFDRCSSGTLLGPDLRNCIPRMGIEVARNAASAVRPIERELDEFREAPIWSKMGFIDPYANPDPDAVVTDKVEIVKKVGEWAKTVVNGDAQQVRDERCICPVLRTTPGGCPVHGG